jgi:SAM-dependent methyltransferase
MTTDRKDRRIFLGMPGYGKQTAAAGRAFWRCCRDMATVTNEYATSSLLAANFNKLWCSGLNIAHQGGRLDYWAMLHDDIGCQDFWLDELIDELEARGLDALGVVVPIKDDRGMTSIALHHRGDNWNPECRLTMHEVYDLPETFTSEDVGGFPLLLNTGCWVVKWNQGWAGKVRFTINDEIVFDKTTNAYYPQTESEDWYFSRLMNELGLTIGATRKISVKHEGDAEFPNTFAWGKKAYDNDSPAHPRLHSPIPDCFPREIPGWLTKDEGKALAEFADGQDVLEIGSYCGLSTVCMARTANRVTACDYFDGRGTPEPMNTREIFDRSIERYGLGHKVRVWHPDQLDEGELPRPEFDRVFIDAAHDYESVAADAVKAMNLLAPNGLLAFHDFKHPMHDGVERVVDGLLLDGGELLSVTDFLAVVRPPAAIPLEVIGHG